MEGLTLSLPMGDWCGPTGQHQVIENRGASIRGHIVRDVEGENKKF
jgi:hypothetical protein